jgi:hypothetical protein
MIVFGLPLNNKLKYTRTFLKRAIYVNAVYICVNLWISSKISIKVAFFWECEVQVLSSVIKREISSQNIQFLEYLTGYFFASRADKKFHNARLVVN